MGVRRYYVDAVSSQLMPRYLELPCFQENTSMNFMNQAIIKGRILAASQSGLSLGLLKMRLLKYEVKSA